MHTNILFPHFDALIRTPDDVAHLEAAILDLAVRGQLVPQDPADEPASALLARIEDERQKTDYEDKVRKPKRLYPIVTEKAPYRLPDSWKWTRMYDIAEVIMGQSPPGRSYNSEGIGIPLINGPVEFGDGVFAKTKMTKFTTSPTKMCKEGDLLICVRGSTTGRTNIAGFDACIGRGVAAIRAEIDQEYLNRFILSHRQQIYDLGTGSTFPSISYGTICGILVPLPPLAEQRRIVARVDELLAQTRALSAELAAAQATHAPAIQATCHALTVAPSPDTLARLFDGDPSTDSGQGLTADAESIAALKQAILQLAVQGKLVPQDPADEPASVLVERIAAEKKRLVKEKKIKRSKILPPITDKEIAYPLPETWIWIRVGNIVEHRLGKMLDKRKNKGKYYPYLRNLNVQWLRIDMDDILEMRFESHELEEYQLQTGDLLICEGGEPGRCAIWEQENTQMMFQKALHRVRPFGNISPKYLLYHLWADATAGTLEKYFTGATIKHFTGKALASYCIALPPLAEQHRIVAKIEALLALCDALAAEAASAEAIRARLVQAVLHKT